MTSIVLAIDLSSVCIESFEYLYILLIKWWQRFSPPIGLRFNFLEFFLLEILISSHYQGRILCMYFYRIMSGKYYNLMHTHICIRLARVWTIRLSHVYISSAIKPKVSDVLAFTSVVFLVSKLIISARYLKTNRQQRNIPASICDS